MNNLKNVKLNLILFTALLLSYLFLVPINTYSQAKKYGVFVGIGKYPDEAQTLLSSENDATEMCKAFSINCGKENAKLILDREATRENILNSIDYYLKDAKKEDLFVFYYSGHGTLFPDRLSEKLDENFTTDFKIKSISESGQIQLNVNNEKYDSALIPFDAATKTSKRNWRNLILDDELFERFAKYTKKGVRVVFISDSCYSGGHL